IGFHLEEYVGLDENAPQSFRRLLLDRLVKRVPMAEFHEIRGEAANPAAVCENYAALLQTRPPDFAVLGIGEDGRLGFNAQLPFDFGNSNPVRVVELDDACRQRLVRDGTFVSLKDVPRRAISFTLPAVLACPRLFVIASGAKTSQAVRDCLHDEIATSYPASLLRNHAGADLFLDHKAS
ncbi:MAG: 6-phosphogluconolactonase, partial [Gammaproteobacteria bacterium]